MLVELLRPTGAELGRRWLACLMLAPEAEREAIVHSIEQRMAELYLEPRIELNAKGTKHAAHPPEHRAGIVEPKPTATAVRDTGGLVPYAGTDGERGR